MLHRRNGGVGVGGDGAGGGGGQPSTAHADVVEEGGEEAAQLRQALSAGQSSDPPHPTAFHHLRLPLASHLSDALHGTATGVPVQVWSTKYGQWVPAKVHNAASLNQCVPRITSHHNSDFSGFPLEG